jgi:hypothetical protein
MHIDLGVVVLPFIICIHLDILERKMNIRKFKSEDFGKALNNKNMSR